MRRRRLPWLSLIGGLASLSVACQALVGIEPTAFGPDARPVDDGGATEDAAGLLDGGPVGDADAAGRCGDGVLDPGEACDEGAAGEDDGCTPDCLFDGGWLVPMTFVEGTGDFRMVFTPQGELIVRVQSTISAEPDGVGKVDLGPAGGDAAWFAGSELTGGGEVVVARDRIQAIGSRSLPAGNQVVVQHWLPDGTDPATTAFALDAPCAGLAISEARVFLGCASEVFWDAEEPLGVFAPVDGSLILLDRRGPAGGVLLAAAPGGVELVAEGGIASPAGSVDGTILDLAPGATSEQVWVLHRRDSGELRLCQLDLATKVCAPVLSGGQFTQVAFDPVGERLVLAGEDESETGTISFYSIAWPPQGP